MTMDEEELLGRNSEMCEKILGMQMLKPLLKKTVVDRDDWKRSMYK